MIFSFLILAPLHFRRSARRSQSVSNLIQTKTRVRSKSGGQRSDKLRQRKRPTAQTNNVKPLRPKKQRPRQQRPRTRQNNVRRPVGLPRGSNQNKEEVRDNAILTDQDIIAGLLLNVNQAEQEEPIQQQSPEISSNPIDMLNNLVMTHAEFCVYVA